VESDLGRPEPARPEAPPLAAEPVQNGNFGRMDQTPYDGWAAMGESSRPFVQYWMDPTAFVSAFVCSFRGLFACVLSPGLRFIYL
jgi:hypothetical protein